MRTYTLTPGVIYEIVGDGVSSVCSGEDMLSRKSRAYKSGSKKKISHQLGYSFCYDANAEDNWFLGSGDGIYGKKQ